MQALYQCAQPPHLQVEGVDVAKLEQRLAEGEEAETTARGRQS